jgi:hypothetical protein
MRKLSTLVALALLVATSHQASAQVMPGTEPGAKNSSFAGWSSSVYGPQVFAFPTTDYLTRRANASIFGSDPFGFDRPFGITSETMPDLSLLEIDLISLNLQRAIQARSGAASDAKNPTENSEGANPLDGLWRQIVFPLDANGQNSTMAGGLPASLSNARADELPWLKDISQFDRKETKTETAKPATDDGIKVVRVPEPGAIGLTGLALAWAIGSVRKARKQRSE